MILQFSSADPATQAANAVAAREAAAARFLLTSEQLAKCREENNPYNHWFLGPAQDVSWALDAPDPCREQWIQATQAHEELQKAEQNLSGSTTGSIPHVQAGQQSNAPTSQDLAAAPAPQLATSGDPVGITDPAIPVSEYTVPDPGMDSMWSPSSIEDVMMQIAEELDAQGMEVDRQILTSLDLIEDNMRTYARWWSWTPGRRAGIKWKPKNQSWVGKWVP